MANVDSYRPPRESYQPPPPPPAAGDGPATRSPIKRREFPPAAPTPPQPSSRTSPPRSQNRSGGQTPLQSRERSPMPASQWLFTNEEVKSTPTIIEGIAPSEERLRRAKGVNFIYQAGVMLDLPQITLWVAGVFFHRFYMRYNMEPAKGGLHHYNIAATALFLANKVEENCRKTKDVIIAVAKVAQKQPKLVIDEQDKEYWRWRDSILTYEELMLEMLTFDLMVDNPYRHLFELLGSLGIVHNKALRQAAWAYCNDACLTMMPLMIEAREVAISAIYFASNHTSTLIDDVNGEPWWVYLRGDKSRVVRAIELMGEFYLENPLRKTNPSLPSPAYRLDVTRRRHDASQSQADTVSSGATPMDMDRGSPSPRANGNEYADTQNTSVGGDSTTTTQYSSKRGPDVDMKDDRDEKKARRSDEDEGEIMEE